MSGDARRAWLDDAAARARFAAVVELEGVGADDADSATRLDEAVAFARPRRGPARFSRIRMFAFPLAIIVGFAALHAARVVPSAAGEDADESSARSLVMQSKFRSVAAGVVAVAGLACAGVAVGDAVEWRVEDGGNGHWYALVPIAGPDFPAALALARGMGGDLASITSAAENQLLFDMSSQTEGALIGANRFSFGTCGAATWDWTDGEAFGYAGFASGQPECEGEDRFLAILHISHWGVGWHDVAPSSTYIRHALVEWSADCNNNGVVDFGEIRNGLAVDTNGNNIPDECECANDPSLAICCPEDIIEDGAVNAIDLAAILNTWGTDGGKFPCADVDGSGTVDGADLAAVLSQWGPCE